MCWILCKYGDGIPICTAALWPCGHATSVAGAVTVQQDSIDPWITCLWVLPFGPREERAIFPFQGFPGLLMCRSHAYSFGELVLEHHAAGADHWRTAAPALSGNENLKTDVAFTHPTARPISRGESQGGTGSPHRWANCPTALLYNDGYFAENWPSWCQWGATDWPQHTTNLGWQSSGSLPTSLPGVLPAGSPVCA